MRHKNMAMNQTNSGRPPTNTEDSSSAYVHVQLNLHRVGQFGCTALHHACLKGQITLARRLIERGLNVNAITKNGTSPLHFAVYKNRVAVAELLLANGAELDLSMPKAGTPLHVAVAEGHDESTKLLLTRGACVDARICGFQPIHVASQRCAKPSIVKKLLQYGARINDTAGSNGDTALHLVVQTAHIEVLKELLSRKPSCLNGLNKAGRAPLHMALLECNEEAATLLLDHDADPNIVAATEFKSTPLLIAVSEELSVTVIEHLLAAGANLNTHAIGDLIPLHFAIMRGNDAVIKLLCNQKGIDVNVRDPVSNATALHFAAALRSSGHSNDRIIRILAVLFGDTPNRSDRSDNTCADRAAGTGTVDDEDASGLPVQTVQINAQDRDGYTPLHLAIATNCDAAALFLLRRGGCDLTIKSYELQYTVLHTACAMGNCLVVKKLLCSDLSTSSIINCRDVFGFTPLHLAIGAVGNANADIETVKAIVKLLLSRGASATARDYYQGTPLQLATFMGSESLIELIRSYIASDVASSGGAGSINVGTRSINTASSNTNVPPSTSVDTTSTASGLSEMAAGGGSPSDVNTIGSSTTSSSGGESTTTSPVGAVDNDDAGAGTGSCVVCRERARCVLVLPCRHLSLCEECAYGSHAQQLMQQCVVCRQPVVDRLTVYL